MPQFQNESKCETIQMKMSLISVGGTHFHMNGFALRPARFDTEAKGTKIRIIKEFGAKRKKCETIILK